MLKYDFGLSYRSLELLLKASEEEREREIKLIYTFSYLYNNLILYLRKQRFENNNDIDI